MQGRVAWFLPPKATTRPPWSWILAGVPTSRFPRTREEANNKLERLGSQKQREALERAWTSAASIAPFVLAGVLPRVDLAERFFDLARLLDVRLSSEQLEQAVRERGLGDRGSMVEQVLGVGVSDDVRQKASAYMPNMLPWLLAERRKRLTEAGTDGRIAVLVPYLVAYNVVVHGFVRPSPNVFALAELVFSTGSKPPTSEGAWSRTVEAWRKRVTNAEAQGAPTVKEEQARFARYLARRVPRNYEEARAELRRTLKQFKSVKFEEL